MNETTAQLLDDPAALDARRRAFHETVGGAVRRHREFQNLSLSQTVDRVRGLNRGIRISVASLSMCEMGKTPFPLHMLIGVCAVFGVSVLSLTRAGDDPWLTGVLGGERLCQLARRLEDLSPMAREQMLGVLDGFLGLALSSVGASGGPAVDGDGSPEE